MTARGVALGNLGVAYHRWGRYPRFAGVLPAGAGPVPALTPAVAVRACDLVGSGPPVGIGNLARSLSLDLLRCNGCGRRQVWRCRGFKLADVPHVPALKLAVRVNPRALGHLDDRPTAVPAGERIASTGVAP